MKETVGKVASELMAKDIEPIHVIDLTEEMLTDWDKNMKEAISSGRDLFKKDFYIHVETKKEKLTPNVLRNYFIVKEACPTPNFSQTIYKYHYNSDTIEELWVIPDRNSAWYIFQNALTLPREQKQLVQYVLDFSFGNLFKKMKELNGEKMDEPVLLKKE